MAAQIDNWLKNYGSPMAGLGHVYVAAGRKYGVDPRLVVAISGAESSAGKHILGAHNAWGWGPGKPFSSWEEGINTVTRGLAKGYISEGRVTPGQIVSKYAPGSDGNNEGHWSQTVGEFMRQMGASPAASAARAVVSSVPTATAPPPASVVPVTKPFDTTKLSSALRSLTTAPPSTAGLQQAALENLANISRTGRASGTALLAGISSGITMDRQADLSNHLHADDLRKALTEIEEANAQAIAALPAPPPLSKPDVPGVKPTGAPPIVPPREFKPGDPVPANRLSSIGARHETLGLPGFPAHDYMATAGTPVVAPVGGKIVRFSGHDPSSGPTNGVHGPFGWSLYLQGDDGRMYYMTHLGSRSIKVGQRVEPGAVLGTIGDYSRWGGADHVHMGVSG